MTPQLLLSRARPCFVSVVRPLQEEAVVGMEAAVVAMAVVAAAAVVAMAGVGEALAEAEVGAGSGTGVCLAACVVAHA
jgi:hypothetical protein